ncbi:TetR/AcrR family transcriptional regulator [Aquimarina rhabdastrellae]
MSKKSIVLQTTLELVTAQGVAATSLSQIIKESGVANGTVYHHFKNKDEIIAELYLMLAQDFGTVIMKNTPQANIKKQFPIMWKNMFYYFINNPLAFVFYEQIAKSCDIPQDLKDEAKKYILDIDNFFREAIKEKIFKPYTVSLMEELFFGSVVTMVKLYNANNSKVLERHINQAVEISWKGFLK